MFNLADGVVLFEDGKARAQAVLYSALYTLQRRRYTLFKRPALILSAAFHVSFFAVPSKPYKQFVDIGLGFH
jgi:hypothetical protein